MANLCWGKGKNRAPPRCYVRRSIEPVAIVAAGLPVKLRIRSRIA